MKTFTLVTGNAHKLEEWRRQVPGDYAIDTADVDLPEIQSLNPEEIVADKARRAYAIVGKPVVVEDVSAAVDALNGLPGPFVKYFVQKLGQNALFELTNRQGGRAVVTCTIAYFDGTDILTIRGDVAGTIVEARGDTGFGFDATFIPDGQTLTYAEMPGEDKDMVSHRSVAIHKFLNALSA